MTAEGKPFVLEVNPNPEISDEAGFANCLNSAGMSYQTFVCKLVRHALQRGPQLPASLGLTPSPGKAELAR